MAPIAPPVLERVDRVRLRPRQLPPEAMIASGAAAIAASMPICGTSADSAAKTLTPPQRSIRSLMTCRPLIVISGCAHTW